VSALQASGTDLFSLLLFNEALISEYQATEAIQADEQKPAAAAIHEGEKFEQHSCS